MGGNSKAESYTTVEHLSMSYKCDWTNYIGPACSIVFVQSEKEDSSLQYRLQLQNKVKAQDILHTNLSKICLIKLQNKFILDLLLWEWGIIQNVCCCVCKVMSSQCWQDYTDHCKHDNYNVSNSAANQTCSRPIYICYCFSFQSISQITWRWFDIFLNVWCYFAQDMF